ncbi:BREX-3 system P-loop-containing protein BrxF [Thiorhodovibrio frisius]|uniref:Zeta toxin n=1 Tax=Thiorhodovibrio frisius TaxID=631362 RepID=H8YWJ4_9GAMM|nr:BREX-3 system P-loop-containing protein BrxF [Thiorhodovibrio frisius]EIC22820.1 Zeta toxin [Thiorhodovibrio frisius]WPL22923.1 hypothetical protein Thiofri_03101 [Thiorhodovibrio frisius]
MPTTEATAAQILEALATAESLYYRLVLLVGSLGAGKSGVLRQVAQQLDRPVINLNLTLSRTLLELTPKQRSLRLLATLNTIAAEQTSPVLLDNTELLFDPSLAQDPLRVLQHMARNRSLLATWNGQYTSGQLIYAQPGHPEYRSYDAVDTLIVSLE